MRNVGLQFIFSYFFSYFQLFNFQLNSMTVLRAGVRARNRHAEILTGIMVTVPQKWRDEGNFPACSTAVCAGRHCAEASKSIDRDCCGPAVSLCSSAASTLCLNWVVLVEDKPSWTQQLSLQPSASSRCAGSRRCVLWQLLNQSCNYGHIVTM